MKITAEFSKIPEIVLALLAWPIGYFWHLISHFGHCCKEWKEWYE